MFTEGFPDGANGKEPTCQRRRHKRHGLEGNGNPLQYSCLENLMDREPGGLQSMGSQSQTQLKQLSMHTCIFIEAKRI